MISYVQVESFSFCSIGDAVALCSPHCFFGVVDIAKAFRRVPVYPRHWQLQGFSWKFGSEAEYFVDNCLCFGLACGPSIFNRISLFIARRMLLSGYVVVLYHHDFLVVWQNICRMRGLTERTRQPAGPSRFPSKWGKIVGPTK